LTDLTVCTDLGFADDGAPVGGRAGSVRPLVSTIRADDDKRVDAQACDVRIDTGIIGGDHPVD